ncbi:MAG: hypothetical protein UH788_07635 [Treponemataceae bacterium]|nr:hypothetical protein [Treponemataceae bacterium]
MSILSFNRSTVRDYVDKVESYFEHTDNQYKGESDNIGQNIADKIKKII